VDSSFSRNSGSADQIKIKPPHRTSTAIPQSGDGTKPRLIGQHIQIFLGLKSGEEDWRSAGRIAPGQRIARAREIFTKVSKTDVGRKQQVFRGSHRSRIALPVEIGATWNTTAAIRRTLTDQSRGRSFRSSGLVP